ncbi:general transcription factor 3C polypeptide 1-like [Uloborus diversus]|uniref:general transcription factor 3C polypeptide 1-like n=1 Tax=Uloborus diversus TaxID=327109 RepID=UPI0024095B8E|nr:general transcription factor 3C polypeptide 1-like [Uloborus diversus]
METSLDFMSSLLDEIALEGLDGITLAMLWERLQHRPHFPLALDDDSKVFLWECIAVHKEVEIYELLQPRQFVPIYNRYEHIDDELGIVLEAPEKLKDPYHPVVFVKDGDIRGSCSTYETRKCITNDIRYDDVLLLALNQVVEKWGDSLVLVASPKARLLALIGTETNPLIDLSAEEYCLLERIGRSRFLGEVTQGEGGLLSLKANFCKQLHYNRKKLTLKGLITKQLHYMKNRKNQATTGSLFHLTRFYVQRKTKMEFLMKCMCDVLKEKPGQREISKLLRQELGVKETSFKKLFYRPFSKWVKIVTMTHKEYYPNASPKECYTTNGQDKIVRVVQMIKHCSEADENDDNVEEEDETEQKKLSSFAPNIYFDHSKVYIDVPFITQVYNIIKEAGPKGTSALDIGRIITLPRLDVRAMLRNLTRRGYIVSVLQDRGRQKVTRYISKIYGEQNIAYARVKEQAEKEKDVPEEIEPIVSDAEQKTEDKIPSSVNNCTPNGILNKRKFDAIADDKITLPRSKRVRFNDTVEKIIFERYDKEKNDKLSSKTE